MNEWMNGWCLSCIQVFNICGKRESTDAGSKCSCTPHPWCWAVPGGSCSCWSTASQAPLRGPAVVISTERTLQNRWPRICFLSPYLITGCIETVSWYLLKAMLEHVPLAKFLLHLNGLSLPEHHIHIPWAEGGRREKERKQHWWSIWPRHMEGDLS